MLASAQKRGGAQEAELGVCARYSWHGGAMTYDPLSEALHRGREAFAGTETAAEVLRRRGVLIGAGPSRGCAATHSPKVPMGAGQDAQRQRSGYGQPEAQTGMEGNAAVDRQEAGGGRWRLVFGVQMMYGGGQEEGEELRGGGSEGSWSVLDHTVTYTGV